MTDIQFSAAADRNKTAIAAQLCRLLGDSERVLEVASGTGQHALHFAAEMPWLTWLPSDPNPQALGSIAARISQSALTNIEPPVALDVLKDWPEVAADALFSANMLHISPAQTLPALCAGAKCTLSDEGLLLIYGPFKRDGSHTSQGNADFDVSLQSRNPNWGIRDLETVVNAAQVEGFEATEILQMPANNLLLVFALAT